MAKKIAVMGTGYVGLVSAVGLADFGNYVTAVDVNPDIITKLSRGEPTIYEPGLHEYLKRNVASGRLQFTTKAGPVIEESDIVFIAVGTPPDESGNADLSQVEAVADTLAEHLTDYTVIVTKSTVPVGTNRRIGDRIAERLKESGRSAEFATVSNPEFLREGKAVQDFFHPDRIVIGVEDDRAREYMEDIYRALYIIETPFQFCTLETAELIKYASNAFLATKITFINQIARLCDAIGADVHVIAKAMGMDGRISPKFLHPGPGYGGSCFPKDTRALVSAAASFGVDMSLVQSVVDANESQKRWLVDRIDEMADGVSGKRVAVLGLAFKAETDDVRESPALTIVGQLLERSASVAAHDPQAMQTFAAALGDSRLELCDAEFDTMPDADMLLVLTEWNEYRNLDLQRARELMKGDLVIDARNVLEPAMVREAGLRYWGVGRPAL